MCACVCVCMHAHICVLLAVCIKSVFFHLNELSVYVCDNLHFHSQINIDLSELELDQNYRTWVRLGHKDPPAENGHKKK